LQSTNGAELDLTAG